MKAVLVAIAVVLGMTLLGWLAFGNSSDETTITIDKKAIEEDTSEAIEKGKELLKEAEDSMREEDRESEL